MEKQTAVSWFAKQLIYTIDCYEATGGSISIDDIKYYEEIANKMDKEQKIAAFEKGNHTRMRGGNFLRPISEEYYNETYGLDKQEEEEEEELEDPLCTMCNGSGEGMYDGSRCSVCGGSGVGSTKGDEFDGY